jgi:hypothetical protein
LNYIISYSSKCETWETRKRKNKGEKREIWVWEFLFQLFFLGEFIITQIYALHLKALPGNDLLKSYLNANFWCRFGRIQMNKVKIQVKKFPNVASDPNHVCWKSSSKSTVIKPNYDPITTIKQRFRIFSSQILQNIKWCKQTKVCSSFRFPATYEESLHVWL